MYLPLTLKRFLPFHEIRMISYWRKKAGIFLYHDVWTGYLVSHNKNRL